MLWVTGHESLLRRTSIISSVNISLWRMDPAWGQVHRDWCWGVGNFSGFATNPATQTEKIYGLSYSASNNFSCYYCKDVGMKYTSCMQHVGRTRSEREGIFCVLPLALPMSIKTNSVSHRAWNTLEAGTVIQNDLKKRSCMQHAVRAWSKRDRIFICFTH